MKKGIFFVMILLGMQFLFAEKITIIRSINWEPYHYIDENGEMQGIMIELLQKVEDNSAFEIDIVTIDNWNRALKIFENNEEQDAFFPIFSNAERAQKFVYLPENILAYERDYFYTKKEDDITFQNDYSNLDKLTIGICKEYDYGKKFSQANNFTKIALNNEKKLVQLLFQSGRFDVILGADKVIENHVYKMGYTDKIKKLETEVYSAPLYIVFKNEDLAKRFGEVLEKVK